MGGWWPQIAPVAGGPAESPIFSLKLWHACKSAFRRPCDPRKQLQKCTNQDGGFQASFRTAQMVVGNVHAADS